MSEAMAAKDRELMELHVEALYRQTPEERLLATREPAPARAPRFFLGRTRGGNLWRLRDDLPGPLVHALDALAAAEPVLPDLPREPASLLQYQNLLREHQEIRHTWLGPAYCFPRELPPSPRVVTITDANSDLLSEAFAWLREERPAWEPAVALIAGGRAVSIAFSSRMTERAAEAGVNTLEAFRGRGYASQVVAAWAIAVRELGRVPLYSTSWSNRASQGVARRLGLQLYGVDFHER